MLKKCTALWREARLEVKCVKNWGVRTTFGSWDVEKVHAVVAQSTFPSQNVQSTTCSRHFWRFRCRFAWQAQGIVHLFKSEQNVRVLGHFHLQPPLQLHCTFTTFYYTTLHYTTLHSITLNYTTLHYTTLHSTTLHYTTLHYITLHYTTFHYTTLHYTTLRYTTFQNTTTTTTQNYATLHYTTLHSTTLQTTLRYITLHYITLNDTAPQTDR